MAGYIGAQGQIRSGLSATIDELNIIDGVTSTTAELNILDGVTATAAEINLIDGGTARGTTAVADGDGFLTNDGGTMRMTKVDTLATYMGTKITGGSMVYLASSGAISNAASVAFTQFDATKYDHYQFMLQHVVPATDGTILYAQTSTNGGTAYSSTDGDYHGAGTGDLTGLRVAGYASYTMGSGTNEFGASGPFMLYAPHNTSSYTFANNVGITYNTSDGAGYIYSLDRGAGCATARIAAEDVDAIKFIFDSGNIESGEIVMYGIANS